MVSAASTATTDQDDPGDRRQVRDVVGVEGDPLRVVGGLPSTAAAAGIGLLGRLVQSIEQVAERAAGPTRRRHEPSGQPQVAEEDDEGDHGGRRANRPNWALSRVQKTASKPTLWNHRASVHRSRPNAEQQDDDQEHAAGDPPADPSATAGPVVRTADGRSSGAAGRVRAAVRRPLRRDGRRPSFGVVVWVIAGVVRADLRGRAVDGSSPRAAASRRRTSSRKSSNRSRIGQRSLRDAARTGPRVTVDGDPRPRGGTRRERSPRARSGASPRPAPARTGRPRGPPVARPTAGSGRRAGRGRRPGAGADRRPRG